MPKVLVGLSGGVDSAAAACLLKEEGFEVVGVTLRTWAAEDGGDSRCCEIDDARSVAIRLDIPYYPLNSLDTFREKVTVPFVKEYCRGFTPNPCVVCNREVKWERMLYYARVLQADYIATGHYAYVRKLENGRFTVQKALHAEKDQTYMLYRLTQEQLGRTLMPLGSLSKEEVRGIAERAGLSVAAKPDSQEICFVPDGDYAGYVGRQAGGSLPPEGLFVDEKGNPLGIHRGIVHYTVGQRRGLGLALGYHVYVKEINAERNEVVVGPENSLYRREILCGDVCFMSIPPMAAGEKLPCRAKIRYHHKAQSAILEGLTYKRVRLLFEEPVRAAAPGQSAVFYDEDDCVIGGGIILKT